MGQSASFTLSANGLSRILISECSVSKPFDPLKGEASQKIEKFNGLWDTGATATVISKKVVDILGLYPSGRTKVYHADGESDVNTYSINLYLPNQVGFNFLEVTEGKLKGADLLIGMDIISSGDFSITNFNMKTTFSFRIPSISTVDFVKEHHNAKFSRNKPCYCGSNKKYKHCHGKT